MRSILSVAALILFASATLHATEAIVFEGGDYSIHVLVGFAEKATVGQVRVTLPGASDWIVLPHELVHVERFDMKKQVLLLRFNNQKKDTALPGPFSLSVKKKNGVLSLDGKKIKGTLDWDI